jgi:crotonobetainyl-CoA:carnitine CoA-transferase CaiB-like acyl-CoA transferase
VAHREALKTALVVALGARPAAEWAAALTAARVPAGVVNDVAGAFKLAESIGLNPIVEVPDPATGTTVALTRNPIGLSRTPPTYRSAPPALDDSA